jgi:hypothetical protein
MSARRRLGKLARRIAAAARRARDMRRSDLVCEQPVFILGCGRSGTTIIGESLGRHPAVCYLNEPRGLWAAAYPETDVWSRRAAQRYGRLVLTSANCNPEASRRIHALFGARVERSGKAVLVEKTPANNFRTAFLDAVFPLAKYVCIHRDGIEVAASIASAAARGAWFGQHEYKWRELLALATRNGILGELTDFPRDDFERGLLEWRLSTEHIDEFLQSLPGDRYRRIDYADFVDNPKRVVNELLGFIGLPPDARVDAFLERNIARRSGPPDADRSSARLRAIAGPALSRTP